MEAPLTVHRRALHSATKVALPVLVAISGLAFADASQAARTIYVGSNGGGIAAFSLAPTGATTLVPGSPFPTSGSFVRAVSVSPDGRFLFNSNTSNETTNAFTIGANGSLTAAPGSPYTDGGIDPTSSVVSPDGKFVAFTNNNFVSHSISVWSIASSGQLTPTAGSPFAVTGANNLGAVAMTPDGRRIYVADQGGTSKIYALDMSTAGILTPTAGFTPATLADVRDLSTAPDGTRLYAARDGASDAVTGFSIAADGALAPIVGANIGVGNDPEAITMSPKGDRMFVINTVPNSVSVLSIAASGGLSSTVGPFVTSPAQAISSLAIAPGGDVLFAGGAVSGTNIFRWSIGAGGALTTLAPSPFASGSTGPSTRGLAITPDQPPTAAATATVGANRTVGFDAAKSSDGDGTIATYNWNFGDGQSASTSTPSTTHTYNADGKYVATLRLTDNEGCSTSVIMAGAAIYCGGSGAAQTTVSLSIDATAPVVSALKAKTRKRKTSLSYSLSESSSVSAAIDRVSKGRKAGKRCAKQTPKNRKRRACARYTKLGAIKQQAVAGSNTITLPAKLGGKRLRPGRYRATLTATDGAGNASKPVARTFKIPK
jgi:6-phosphogluconolactonase (cycloisomerase 2 family)